MARTEPTASTTASASTVHVSSQVYAPTQRSAYAWATALAVCLISVPAEEHAQPSSTSHEAYAYESAMAVASASAWAVVSSSAMLTDSPQLHAAALAPAQHTQRLIKHPNAKQTQKAQEAYTLQFAEWMTCACMRDH